MLMNIADQTDGIVVGTAEDEALLPQSGSLNMPSDASADLWLAELENLD